MFILLDNSSPIPLYQQITNEIRAKIISGELKPGDPLPSIRQLASDLVTSVITTKRAYQELEAEGLVSTLPGRGTFVASPRGISPIELGRREVEEQLREVVRNALRLGLKSTEVRALFEKSLKMGEEQ